MTMWMRRVRLIGAVALGVTCVQVFGPEAGGTAAAPAVGQAAPASASAEKTVWYFYTVKWGKQERFVDLFQRNHYPILRAQVGTRFKSVSTFVQSSGWRRWPGTAAPPSSKVPRWS